MLDEWTELTDPTNPADLPAGQRIDGSCTKTCEEFTCEHKDAGIETVDRCKWNGGFAALGHMPAQGRNLSAAQ